MVFCPFAPYRLPHGPNNWLMRNCCSFQHVDNVMGCPLSNLLAHGCCRSPNALCVILVQYFARDQTKGAVSYHVEVGTKWPPIRRRHFQVHSLNEFVLSLQTILMKYLLWGLIDDMATLVQIMAWRWTGDNPLSEPMLVCCTDAYMCRSASMCCCFPTDDILADLTQMYNTTTCDISSYQNHLSHVWSTNAASRWKHHRESPWLSVVFQDQFDMIK